MPHPTDPVRPEDGTATYDHHIPGAPVIDEADEAANDVVRSEPKPEKYCYAARPVESTDAAANLASRDNIVKQ